MLLAAVPSAWAAPEEIQVYLDEFAETGKFGLDFHVNQVLVAQPDSVTRRMLRITPELSYGISDHWEAGFYALTSTGPEQAGGRPVTDGVKARLKWRPFAPSEDSPWYGAVNFEIGQLSRRFYAEGTAAEVKFIGVYRKGPWVFGANLNIDRALRAYAQQGATAEFDSKASYRVLPESEGGLQLGVENYFFLGPRAAHPGGIRRPSWLPTSRCVDGISISESEKSTVPRPTNGWSRRSLASLWTERQTDRHRQAAR
ncbi:MAG: hypothetical protein NVS2B16_32930 [Chloroflexota bacterium]